MHYENFRRPVWTISVTGLAQMMADIDRYKAGHRHPAKAADATGAAPDTTAVEARAEAQAWDAAIAAAPLDPPHTKAYGKPKPKPHARGGCHFPRSPKPIEKNLGGRPSSRRQPWRPGDPKP